MSKVSAETSREYTQEEIERFFLEYLWQTIAYWDRQTDRTPRGKMEGLTHSILVALDGMSSQLPAFVVSPCPSPDDKRYAIENGENWYPDFPEKTSDLVDIAGSLHEKFYRIRERKE